MAEITETVMNVVFTAFAVYAFRVAQKWNRAADKMNAVAEELQKELEG